MGVRRLLIRSADKLPDVRPNAGPAATPTDTHPMRSQTRRFRAEWLAMGVMQSIIAVVLCGMLYREHANVEAEEGDRLGVQARVVDENLIRQLEGAEKALAGIGADLRQLDVSFDAPSLTAKLGLLTGAMPGISSMLVLDGTGTIVAASREGLVGRNFRQREYFDAPRRGVDAAALYVSPPFTTTLGTYVIVVSRAITNPRGQFIGVVTATLDPDYFNVVLRSVRYAPDMRTTLVHNDGKVFLNMPPDAAALGRDLSTPTSIFTRHQRSGRVATLAQGLSMASGDQRMFAMRTIDRADLSLDKPLVVSVSRELGAIFGPWRARAWQLGTLMVVFMGICALALWLNHRRRSVSGALDDAVARERQLGAERVELALRGADLGLWDLHVPTDRFVINARERALLGYAADDELPQGAAWRELIHPDDVALLDAAIVPHLRGEAATYECEHRMRHRDGHDVWLLTRAMIVERDAANAPVRIVGTHLDITERKRGEERLALATAMLRDSEEELRLVTDHLPALVSRIDLEMRFRFTNRAYEDWLGIAPASLLGRSLAEVYGNEVYDSFKHHIERALAGEKVTYERDLETPTGMRRAELTLVPQIGRNGQVKGLYALATDITARKLAEGRLRRLAEFDTLTGLPNRALFHDRLQQAMARAARGKPMALLFLDIDHFKTINDTLGHAAGDKLLKVFAHRMQATIRESDTVARLAGDEFTIVLEALRDLDDAKMLATKLVDALRQPIELDGQTLAVTASIGVTLCVPGESDDAALLRRADAALYEAKRRGRNGYFCAEASTTPAGMAAPVE
jgi:diguanylate cyclase (GGDEF)-like protein/PAS domain S-box-containing protein